MRLLSENRQATSTNAPYDDDGLRRALQAMLNGLLPGDLLVSMRSRVQLYRERMTGLWRRLHSAYRLRVSRGSRQNAGGEVAWGSDVSAPCRRIPVQVPLAQGGCGL